MTRSSAVQGECPQDHLSRIRAATLAEPGKHVSPVIQWVTAVSFHVPYVQPSVAPPRLLVEHLVQVICKNHVDAA
jgi:hypothetical protein